MFKNTNHQISYEIARKTIFSYKLRNLMAILAIVITTILITTTFITGAQVYEAVDRALDVAPGPMSDGAITTDINQRQKFQQIKDIEWVSDVRPGNIGSLHNKELVGIQSVLRIPDASFYKNNHVNMIEGHKPKLANEVIISKAISKKLGEKGKVGQRYLLKPVIKEKGKLVVKEISMKIVGIFSSPLDIILDTYEELYANETFLKNYAPEMLGEKATFYIKFKGENSSAEKITRLDDIAKITRNGTVQFRLPNISLPMWIVIVPLVCLIMLCGYFLIYNVFYISMMDNIQFYGMLKTIGASGKQLKKMIATQVWFLMIPGLLMGFLIGVFLSFWVAPFVLGFTEFHNFYQPNFDIRAIFLAISLSIFTVWISNHKIYRLLKTLTPIEINKYIGNKRKKHFISILSLSLSSIIFLFLYTETFGYDIEKMVDRYNTTDFTINQKAMLYENPEKYQPIQQEMIHELKNLDFVQKTHLFYQAKDMAQTESKEILSKQGFGYFKNMGFIKRQYEHQMEIMNSKDPDYTLMPYQLQKNNNIALRVIGLPADQLSFEKDNLKIIDGVFDQKKFSAGGYVIFNQEIEDSNRKNPVKAGDWIHLSVYDPFRKIYTDQKMKIMAVVESINPFPTQIIGAATLTFSDHDFKKIYPNYNDLIAHVKIDTKKELNETEFNQLKSVVHGSFNTQISFHSKYQRRIEAKNTKRQMTVVGLLISLIFGLIGIANFINTLVTDILARKLEYATMQSIGMTKKQMTKDLMKSGIKLCLWSTLITIPSAVLLMKQMDHVMLFFTGFKFSAFIQGCIILCFIMILVVTVTSLLLTIHMNQKSISERIAEARQ